MAPGSGALSHGAKSAGSADLSVRSRWKEFRYRLEWFAVWLLTKIVPLLPRVAAYYAAQIFGALAAHVDRHGRRVALANLRCAFRGPKSPREERKLVRQSYQHFARTMIDLFWSPRLTKENFLRYIEFANLDEWRASMGPGDSYIVACYHYSNFEWLSLGAGFLGYNSSIIAQEFKNPLLDPIFKQLRELAGHAIVPREGGAARLYRTLKRNGRVAILADLTIRARSPAVAIDCFGLKTCVTFVHAWLHDRTGVPIIPAHCEPLPRGRYRIVFHPPIEVADRSQYAQIVQACWNAFEPHLRANPAPWLWMYKHWRYWPGAERCEKYPFYANFSEDFEVRLQESGFPAVLPENAASLTRGNY